MSQANDFVPFFLPSISEEEKKAVLKVLDSGWLTTGKEALEFEKEFVLNELKEILANAPRCCCKR